MASKPTPAPADFQPLIQVDGRRVRLAVGPDGNLDAAMMTFECPSEEEARFAVEAIRTFVSLTVRRLTSPKDS